MKYGFFGHLSLSSPNYRPAERGRRFCLEHQVGSFQCLVGLPSGWAVCLLPGFCLAVWLLSVSPEAELPGLNLGFMVFKLQGFE